MSWKDNCEQIKSRSRNGSQNSSDGKQKKGSNGQFETVENVSEKGVHCVDCKMYFETKYLLELHFRKKQKGKPLLICPICRLTFMLHKNLILHKQMHHKIQPSAVEEEGSVDCFACKFCRKKFITKYNLKRHVIFSCKRNTGPKASRKQKGAASPSPRRSFMKIRSNDKCHLTVRPIRMNCKTRKRTCSPPRIGCRFCRVTFKARKYLLHHHILFHKDTGKNVDGYSVHLVGSGSGYYQRTRKFTTKTSNKLGKKTKDAEDAFSLSNNIKPNKTIGTSSNVPYQDGSPHKETYCKPRKTESIRNSSLDSSQNQTSNSNLNSNQRNQSQNRISNSNMNANQSNPSQNRISNSNVNSNGGNPSGNTAAADKSNPTQGKPNRNTAASDKSNPTQGKPNRNTAASDKSIPTQGKPNRNTAASDKSNPTQVNPSRNTAAADKSNPTQGKPRRNTAASDKSNPTQGKPNRNTAAADKSNPTQDNPSRNTAASDKSNPTQDNPSRNTAASDKSNPTQGNPNRNTAAADKSNPTQDNPSRNTAASDKSNPTQGNLSRYKAATDKNNPTQGNPSQNTTASDKNNPTQKVMNIKSHIIISNPSSRQSSTKDLNQNHVGKFTQNNDDANVSDVQPYISGLDQNIPQPREVTQRGADSSTQQSPMIISMAGNPNPRSNKSTSSCSELVSLLKNIPTVQKLQNRITGESPIFQQAPNRNDLGENCTKGVYSVFKNHPISTPASTMLMAVVQKTLKTAVQNKTNCPKNKIHKREGTTTPSDVSMESQGNQHMRPRTHLEKNLLLESRTPFANNATSEYGLSMAKTDQQIQMPHISSQTQSQIRQLIDSKLAHCSLGEPNLQSSMEHVSTNDKIIYDKKNRTSAEFYSQNHSHTSIKIPSKCIANKNEIKKNRKQTSVEKGDQNLSETSINRTSKYKTKDFPRKPVEQTPRSVTKKHQSSKTHPLQSKMEAKNAPVMPKRQTLTEDTQNHSQSSVDHKSKSDGKKNGTCKNVVVKFPFNQSNNFTPKPKPAEEGTPSIKWDAKKLPWTSMDCAFQANTKKSKTNNNYPRLSMADAPRNVNIGPSNASKAVSCSFCGHWFTAKQGLQKHLMYNCSERHIQCFMCPGYFTNVDNFRKHLEEFHTLSNFTGKNLAAMMNSAPSQILRCNSTLNSSSIIEDMYNSVASNFFQKDRGQLMCKKNSPENGNEYILTTGNDHEENLLSSRIDDGNIPLERKDQVDLVIDEAYNQGGWLNNEGYSKSGLLMDKGHNPEGLLIDEGYNPGGLVNNEGYNHGSLVNNEGYNKSGQLINEGYNQGSLLMDEGYTHENTFINNTDKSSKTTLEVTTKSLPSIVPDKPYQEAETNNLEILKAESFQIPSWAFETLTDEQPFNIESKARDPKRTFPNISIQPIGALDVKIVVKSDKANCKEQTPLGKGEDLAMTVEDRDESPVEGYFDAVCALETVSITDLQNLIAKNESGL